MAVNLVTNHFRWGKDDGTEAAHTWWANEDVNPAAGGLPLDTAILLRFNEQETGGTAAANTDATFEFRINGGTWTALTTTSVGPRAVAVAAFTNGQACTQRLSGTGTFETSGAGCTEDGTSGGTANDIAASGCSETECGLIVDSADVVAGDVIEFRLTSPDWTVTNNVVPTFTVPTPVTKTHTTDAVVQVTSEKTHSADAVVLATAERVHSANAVVQTTAEIVHFVDAAVLKTTSLSHSTDAYVSAGGGATVERSHTTDVVVVKTLTLGHTVDASVSGTATRTHTVDAYVGLSWDQRHPRYPNTGAGPRWPNQGG